MSAAADNSIRAQFQPEVDEFIDDLTTFATGSYLQDEDKDLWEEPVSYTHLTLPTTPYV